MRFSHFEELSSPTKCGFSVLPSTRTGSKLHPFRTVDSACSRTLPCQATFAKARNRWVPGLVVHREPATVVDGNLSRRGVCEHSRFTWMIRFRHNPARHLWPLFKPASVTEPHADRALHAIRGGSLSYIARKNLNHNRLGSAEQPDKRKHLIYRRMCPSSAHTC